MPDVEPKILQAVGKACRRICADLDAHPDAVAEALLAVVATIAIGSREPAEDFGARARDVYLGIVRDVEKKVANSRPSLHVVPPPEETD